jgi:hypothetical protein
MKVQFLTLWCSLLLATTSIVLADDTPVHIKPEEARMHVDKKVEVVLEVKHAKYSERRKTAFLDSEENFQDEKNLGIAITEAGIQDLKQKRAVDGPADYYRGKTIRVTGTVILKEDKPYIEVTQAEQLDLAPQ